MIQLNQNEPKARSSNFKLMLTALASTAVIGASAVYLTSSKSSSESGSSLMNMIPDEFTVEVALDHYDPREPKITYQMTGHANVWNDENGEWEAEAYANEVAFSKGLHREYFLIDNTYYQAKIKSDNKTDPLKSMECLMDYKQLGYATWKHAMAKAVEVESKDLDQETLKRVKANCGENTSKYVFETDDFETLLICAESQNKGLSGAIFAKEFSLKFRTVSEKKSIILPKTAHVGLFYADGKCEQSNKFETVVDFDMKESTPRQIRDMKYFDKVADTFPFTDRRKLDELFPDYLAHKGIKDYFGPEVTELDQQNCRGPCPTRPPTYPVKGGNKQMPTAGSGNTADRAYCHFIMGAGNQRGWKKKDKTNKEKKSKNWNWYRRQENCTSLNDPKCLSEDETIYRNGRMDTTDLQASLTTSEYLDFQTKTEYNNVHWENMIDKYHSINRNGEQWNGSACLYRFLDTRYPKCFESFYPYMIDAGTQFVGGILRDQCHQAVYWSGNSADRGHNEGSLITSVTNFLCGHDGCIFGPKEGGSWLQYHNIAAHHVHYLKRPMLVYTHSFGGLSTSSAFANGHVIKGPYGHIAMSQGPVKGSSAASFSDQSCKFNEYWDWNYGNIYLRKVIRLVVKLAYQKGYCNADETGARDVWGVSLMWHQPRNFEGMAWFAEDWGVNYRYCGTNPAGLFHEVFDLGGFNYTNSALTGLNTLENIIQGGAGFSSLLHGDANTYPYIDLTNAASLFGLTLAPCLLHNWCQQMYCKSTGAACHWRGCVSYNDSNTHRIGHILGNPTHWMDQYNHSCDHSRLSNWANDMFSVRTDGMVNLNSCLGVTQVAGGQYDQMDPNFTYKGDPAILEDDILDAGEYILTSQPTNHEDGTGTNGNSYLKERKPVTWYLQVAKSVVNMARTSSPTTGSTWMITDSQFESDLHTTGTVIGAIAGFNVATGGFDGYANTASFKMPY